MPGRAQGPDRRLPRQAEVKAHDGGPHVQQHRQHRVVDEEAAIYLAKHGRRLGTQRREVRTQMRDPAAFRRHIGARGLMAEQVDVERAVGRGPHLRNHRARAVRVGGAYPKRTQRTRLDDGGRHGRRRYARHRRLDDRQANAQKVQEGIVHGHGGSVLPSRCRAGNRAWRSTPQSLLLLYRSRRRMIGLAKRRDNRDVRGPQSHCRTTMAFRSTRLILPAMLALAPVHAGAAPQSLLPPGMLQPAPGTSAPSAVPPPPVALPQVLAPALPLPKLNDAQAAFLREWLTDGARQGLTSGSTHSYAGLSGDALVRAALDRATALRRGRVDTADFLNIWALRPPSYDPLSSFTMALKDDRLQQWTLGLTPRYAGYEGLRKGLARYEEIKADGGWKTLSAKSGLVEIRARLRIEDPAVTDGEPVSAAIQRAQRRYGLEPTGTLGDRTLAALNVPVEERIGAIMANMERWRWLPPTLADDRIQVNIAAAVLTVFEGDQPVSSMRAVTGSPDNQTPMLTSTISSIVVNPPWNVPTSIANRELWPKGRAKLAAQGYIFVKTPDGGERLVQKAGPTSALGRLKFDFANPFAVYLHDTPSRGKFSSFDRLASHGCVRLEKPVPLAERLVLDDPTLSGQVQTMIDTGKTQRISVPKPIAVYLLYWTAFASANGTMNFRDDPYGWDSLLADKIDASTRRAQAQAIAAKEP